MRLGRVRARGGVSGAEARHQLVPDGGGELRGAQLKILVVQSIRRRVRRDGVELRARLHEAEAANELGLRAVVHALGDQRLEELARRGAAVGVERVAELARAARATESPRAAFDEARVHPVHVPARGGCRGDRDPGVRERDQRLPRPVKRRSASVSARIASLTRAAAAAAARRPKRRRRSRRPRRPSRGRTCPPPTFGRSGTRRARPGTRA